jgi:hypothetical protein
MQSTKHVATPLLSTVSPLQMGTTLVTYNTYLTATIFCGSMKNAVFWDVTPCGSFNNQGFRGT